MEAWNLRHWTCQVLAADWHCFARKAAFLMACSRRVLSMACCWSDKLKDCRTMQCLPEAFIPRFERSATPVIQAVWVLCGIDRRDGICTLRLHGRAPTSAPAQLSWPAVQVAQALHTARAVGAGASQLVPSLGPSSLHCCGSCAHLPLRGPLTGTMLPTRMEPFCPLSEQQFHLFCGDSDDEVVPLRTCRRTARWWASRSLRSCSC